MGSWSVRSAGHVDQELKHEAHIPAEQSAPGEDSWVPDSDAHSCGPGNPCRAPLQGSGPALGLAPHRWSVVALMHRDQRMRRSDDFRVASRGQRIRIGRLVLTAALRSTDPADGVRVGFAVGRNVGNSVVRHRVVRRLRAIMRSRTSALPAGARVVVRGLPGCADASHDELTRWLDEGLERLRLARSA